VGARLLYLLLRTRGLFLSLAANHVPDILVNYFLTGSLERDRRLYTAVVREAERR
jgi:hypothetical protein